MNGEHGKIYKKLGKQDITLAVIETDIKYIKQQLDPRQNGTIPTRVTWVEQRVWMALGGLSVLSVIILVLQMIA